MTELGIEVFIKDKPWQHQLENKRIAFLGNSASAAQNLENSLDLIQTHTPLKLSCILGPQHGFHAVEQANMVTTENATWNHVPVFSLYSSKTRRLTKEMLSLFDVLIVDLQDAGCRVYTYLSTLLLALEDCHHAQKEVWILDRPNPAGRDVEGSLLNKNFASFVGIAPIPIRYGMTLGEIAQWYCTTQKLNPSLKIIKMKGYHIDKHPWPPRFPWVLPSPNMVDQEGVYCYSGTVLLEGTLISEARGTGFPLKAFGYPNMPSSSILSLMQKTPQWLKGCYLREEFFKPAFDKNQNQICSGIRIYATPPFFKVQSFRPYRLVSLFLKSLLQIQGEFDWKLKPPYEYEYKKWPIDILSGDDFLRHWIEDQEAHPQDLEAKLSQNEQHWEEERRAFLLY